MIKSMLFFITMRSELVAFENEHDKITFGNDKHIVYYTSWGWIA
jgi:hypothetical protein